MLKIDENAINKCASILQNNERPMKERFRALFTLRNIGGAQAIKSICDCFNDQSALLKHELAYCLGQMTDVDSIPELIKVLENKSNEPMVRHEAGEALGAIGDVLAVHVLRNYVNDTVQEVAETCQLALERIELMKREKVQNQMNQSKYTSVDPAPPLKTTDLANLKSLLLNEDNSLFERYRAMFSLRNLETDDAVEILAEGLECRQSALFRHEIAFVLGQMQSANEKAIALLKSRLDDTSENEMVRHECAEALGSIGGEDIESYLRKYLNDASQVVRESCEIALDINEYNQSDEFQYANTIGAGSQLGVNLT